MLNADDLNIVIEYIAASDDMHRMYGSTATCGGGVGGQAMTPHCSHICHNPVHTEAQDRYDNAYRAVRQLAEESKAGHARAGAWGTANGAVVHIPSYHAGIEEMRGRLLQLVGDDGTIDQHVVASITGLAEEADGDVR